MEPQPKSPLQPFRLPAAAPASQPASTLLNSALSHARIHTYTLLPLVHIWPSLICCIRKDGGKLKGGERERQRNVKKHEATQHEYWHSSQIHDRQTQMLTHPASKVQSGLAYRAGFGRFLFKFWPGVKPRYDMRQCAEPKEGALAPLSP